MNWRLLDNHSEEDKRRYNEFNASSPKGHILQSWEWGELKSAGEWTALRLVAEDGGAICGAMLLLRRALPFGLGSFFYAPRGPVLDIRREEVWNCLLEGIRVLAARMGAVFCKMDPDVPEGDPWWSEALANARARSAIRGEGFEGVQPRYVFRLDICPSGEELLSGFHQKTRYNIRLAEKKGVSVEEDAPRELLWDFYKILKETAERDRFLIRSVKYYEDFYDKLVKPGLASMFIVRYQGEIIAGSLAFLLGDKTWYIYGASSNRHRNVMPNYLLQWRMILWAQRHGCRMYDFRGVPGLVSEDHPLFGLVKFKRGFGGEYVAFIGEYDIVFKGAKYRFYNIAQPLYKGLMRRMIMIKRYLKKA